MHRVFIPTDDLTRHDHWLHHPRSIEDLTALGPALKSGDAVTLVTPNGAELPAVLRFQDEVNCWIAYPAPRSGR